MQNSISSLLVNIGEDSSSAHSYIIEGRPGPKREEFVRNFVKGINCRAENPSDRPCGLCPACKQIDAGSSLDVFVMPMSGKTSYKVEDSEELIARMRMGSYERHTIGIVEDADAMSEVIQNKLLKTLEEPEEGSIILLLAANRDNLISTVRSRCIVIRASEYIDEEEKVERQGVMETAELMRSICGFGTNRCNYYEFRNAVDKKIKSREDAIELIGIIEDSCREYMISGSNPGAMARAIDVLELARMDIYKGMTYSKALRRVFLELV